jgi:hypothetical protein
MFLKSQLGREYLLLRTPRAHVRMHFYEVASWLPQVLLMMAIAALLAWKNRRRAA